MERVLRARCEMHSNIYYLLRVTTNVRFSLCSDITISTRVLFAFCEKKVRFSHISLYFSQQYIASEYVKLIEVKDKGSKRIRHFRNVLNFFSDEFNLNYI